MKTSPRTQAHPRLGASGGVLRPTLLASAIALALAAPGTAVPRELPLHEARLALLREGQILANTAATVLAARATDRDNDGTLEPPAMRDAWGPTSRIGQLPAGFGVPQADGYGTPLGYCAFDNGSTTSGANLVPGTLNGGRLLAVVFAGADRTLQTTCADIAAGSTRGDDFVSVRDTSQTLLSAGVSLTRPPVLNAAALTNLITGRPDDVIDTPNDPLLNGELRLTTADNRLWRFEAGSPLSAQRPNGRREGRFVAVVADVMPVGPGDVTEFENLLVRGNLQVNGASSLIGGATVGAVGASARLQVLGTGGLLVDGAPGSANVRLGALAGLAAPVAPPGFDRLVIADAEGRLNQASLESLVGSVVGSLGNVWTTRGNANTDPGVNFLGTLDAQDLVIRTNNLERVRIAASTGAAQFTGPLRGSAGLDITGTALLRSGAVIGSASASERALVLQGATGQAANLLEARSGANELVLSIGPGGAVVAAGSVQTPLVSTGRVEAAGLLNLGAADASSTPAQVQLSIAGQTRLSVNATGTLVSAEGLTVAGTPGTSNIRLQALGGNANALLPASTFDRVVVANSSGLLQQVTPAGLLNNTVWLLSGNADTVSAGALGEAASGSFVGTRDATDLRLVTQGTVRLIVSADGAVSTQRDLLVNGLTVGRGGGSRADNTAFGLGALGLATTGGANVAVGRQALGALVGGTGNTAVGDRALATVSGQGGNVAVGTEALTASAAANATAVGFGALQANTTGSGGTAVGNRALASNTTGTANVALGQRALQSNTTGSFNVALGQNALGGADGNLTGSRNVALGVDAGRYLANEDPNAAGENSIYIGAGSRAGPAPAQTNQIVIGFEASGLGSNTVVLGNDQIALTALRGQVGVNTPVPGGQLAVASALPTRVGLVSRGAIGQTASLFEAQSWNGTTVTTVASIASTGSASFTGLTVEGRAGTPNVTLASLGGTVNTALPAGFDRVVVADAQGRLQQVTPGQLIQNNVWLSGGNSGTTSAGALGAVATGNRLGTLDAADLRIVTDGRVRAIVSATGAISTERDLTVNGLTLGRGGGNREENVAFGLNALRANQTSVSNIAIGRSTLAAQTGGGGNVAVGDQALSSVVDTWGNVAVGTRALQRSVGGGSTAVGHQTLVNNTNGFGHVAVGAGALGANTSGDGNTALGYNALQSNTTGTYNVAIGYATLGGEDGNVDGVLNVAVGAGAGRNVSVNGVETPNTSGDRSVFLGAYTHAGGPDQTNQIVIGHTAVGLGSHTAVLGNGQIRLTRLNGQVGINTSTPAAQLQVDAASASRVGLIVRGSTTPTVDLMRVQTAAATVPEVRIDSTGVLRTERQAFINGVRIGVGTGPGVGNLVVGVNAMEGSTLASSQYNTAIGVGTMRYNRGQHNTVLGYGILGVASGGSYNTAVGYRVLSNATGNNNVVVGYMSGDQLATGNGNTVVGVNAARSLTAGAANVLIGFQAGESLGTTYSNRLAISNNLSSTLIYGEFDRGRLMVNAPASPGALNAALQVNTTTSTDRGLVVRGALGQSVNLFEVQDVGGSALVQITRDGRLGVGRAPDTGFQVDVAGDLRATRVFAGANLLTSDARFKTNITPVADALALVQRLQGVNFDWNRAAFPTRGFSSRPQIGVLAQQVETVLPQLVDTDAEGYKSVNYTGFIPVLIEGMKAQQGVLAQHAGRLDGAEALLQAHGSRLQQAEEGLSRVVERTGVLERGLTRADERIARLTERADRTDGFLERFDASSADSLVVRTPNLRVSNLTAERAAVEELVARRLEAEQARFQSFEADEGRVSGALQARSVNAQRVASGERELFVSLGTVAPLFEVPEGAHFQVTVSSRDGSFASATVLRAGGQLRVLRMAAEGIELVPQGSAVGVMAPSRTIKASWLRTG